MTKSRLVAAQGQSKGRDTLQRDRRNLLEMTEMCLNCSGTLYLQLPKVNDLFSLNGGGLLFINYFSIKTEQLYCILCLWVSITSYNNFPKTLYHALVSNIVLFSQALSKIKKKKIPLSLLLLNGISRVSKRSYRINLLLNSTLITFSNNMPNMFSFNLQYLFR